MLAFQTNMTELGA